MLAFVMPLELLFVDLHERWINMTYKTDMNNESHHDDVIKWKHFPRYLPFVRGIHRSPLNPPHKRPVTRGFGVFFHLCLNKRMSKQSWGWWFGRHRGYYDVIVICFSVDPHRYRDGRWQKFEPGHWHWSDWGWIHTGMRTSNTRGAKSLTRWGTAVTGTGHVQNPLIWRHPIAIQCLFSERCTEREGSVFIQGTTRGWEYQPYNPNFLYLSLL